MKPGIYDLSAVDYAKDPCEQPSLSSGIANLLCQSSPLHAKTAHPKLTPETEKEEAEHFDIGTVAHALLLEGYSVAEVLPFPDWRKEAAREARIIARKAGKVPILEKHWVNVLGMVAAARTQLDAHKQAKDAFLNGRPEQTIIWEEDGVLCRARPDWLHDSHLAIDDFKTTGASANPEVISRTLFSNGWDVQCAFYIRGLKAVSDRLQRANYDPIFRFVVQETYPPYALSVIALGPDSMMIAEKKVEFAINLWRKCLTSGEWPGYPQRICYAQLPKWEEERWLEQELA